jgi:hypothetical protein
MKKKKLIKNEHLRRLAILRRIRRSYYKQKERNKRRKKKDTALSKYTEQNEYQQIKKSTIKVDRCFSLLENPDSVARLANEIDVFKTNVLRLQRIQLDLSEIQTIDIGAITFLLAKVHEMNRIQRIQIWGNMPNDANCKEIFFESGFLDYMRSLSGQSFEKHSENYIINLGKEKTLNEQVGKSIKRAVKFLTGIENHYPPVFSIVQEMCSNSVEHANNERINKNWFLGVNCVEESNLCNRHVVFTMTDVGLGILKTIKRKFGTIISEKMVQKSETEILYRAFQKQYQSKTEEVNRNRGLPRILDIFEKQHIKDLKVITNNVYLDFDERSKSRVLGKNLPGTFYYWVLDLNSIKQWNQPSLS